MFGSIKQIIHQIGYKIAIKYYKLPRSCKVNIFSNLKNIKCEGYNTIGSHVVCRNIELGYASGISKDSIFINTKIGRYTALAPRISIIQGLHPTANFVSIHPSFYSLKKQYGFTYVNKQKFNEFKYADYEEKYSVIIGNDVWIGSDVKILEGVIIGDGAIIAAGAVVTKNIPAYSIVGGVPAKLIRYRFEEKDIEFLLRLQWWNKPKDWINMYSEYFDDIKRLKEVLKNEKEN